MPKAIANSLLGLLMTATLFWGGCISCPKFFMFPQAKKNCCVKTGQCERPAKSAPLKECKRIPLELQNAAHAHLEFPPVAAAGSIFVLSAVTPAPSQLSFEKVALEPSPPDLIVLHSTFLI